MTEISSLSCLFWLSVVFIIGYVAIAFEQGARVNKAATAILMAIMCWSIISFCLPQEGLLNSLQPHFEQAAEIVIFLLGAMAIVEVVDSHRGFTIITNFIVTRSHKKLLFYICIITFFLSSVLDNLTTTIVMISLLRKLIEQKEERMLLGGMVVVAANAGGAWTPIGDVTTTMLWINGQISTIGIIKALFLPSVVAMGIPLFILSFFTTKKELALIDRKTAEMPPYSRLIFWLGIGSLIFVPIFKLLTGLPPFMGMMLGLGFMWLITDIIHAKSGEKREYLRLPHILTKVDISGVLFFLGILLAVSSLEVAGILKGIALWLDYHLSSQAAIACVIGFFSAIVDNVPLVAATMGMYPLSEFPQDAPLWEMIAYAAGTGGSILIVGSAAGIAFMGMEKIRFGWYLKKISLVATLGYLGGFLTYLAFS
ncbi:MAG: sodium:proton antiporter NhaD [Chlamydiae bacterium]|nr:sodium:proton antiporter NhaD [Chlamydiota bacterium]